MLDNHPNETRKERGEVPPYKGGGFATRNRGVYQIVDLLSNFLVSLAFLLPVFFAFMGYRYYEIHTLFESSLVSQIQYDADRNMASILIAIVGVFTTLIFMVNSDKLAPVPFKDDAGKITWRWDWSKLVLVLYAFIINAFFWEPWYGANQYDTWFRWFSCVMFSSMDFGFAHLFKELRKDRGLQHDISNAEQTLSNLKQNTFEEEHYLSSLKQQREQLQQVIADHTCPYCKELQPSPASLRTHKGHCKSKPSQIRLSKGGQGDFSTKPSTE